MRRKVEAARPALKKKKRSSVGLMFGKRKVFHEFLKGSRTESIAQDIGMRFKFWNNESRRDMIYYMM